MKSDKFIACCFVEVPKGDVFCNYEFKDSLGRSHIVVGKRGDWLYITDGDRIFTKNQLLIIKSRNDEIQVGIMGIISYHASLLLKHDVVNKARSLPGAEF
ncbi:hypothetical protein ACOZGJ_000842 [Escherichia coli]|jgi:hypothetical protein|uniref:hypothetical protein n=1 Tax=Escherichia coli TaxID=562 RepID=UPI00038FBD11|nr:hypothetical protein [Escherichia coli]EQP56723.1 hypothetical protein G736_01605 [Escherichia coli HVH 70 (4-2963531)]DAZ01885.1 MAG TPA: hypothetical protein [Caudoviricetes sp.]